MTGTSVIDLTIGDDAPTFYVVEVHGQPKALPRSRHFRRGFFHPARREMAAFKATVLDGIPVTVPFAKGVPVCMELEFYMRRPNTDFKNNNRNGVLKSNLQQARPTIPDIDNLVKFVLDSLNGVLYCDDRQVVKVTAVKLLDNKQGCNGSRTVIKCYKYHN